MGVGGGGGGDFIQSGESLISSSFIHNGGVSVK